MEPLRIGILGAARITELALVTPANATGARLVAVAARDRGRAERFAATHGVERVVDSYDDLLADGEVEAIYNPLANSLHGPWNKRALLAGKHVLSEKPSAGNGPEAAELEAIADGVDRVFMEGFHYRYHPMIRRAHAVVAGGEIGELRRVESRMDTPAPADDDPRWSFALAGGALMDLGCYSLHSFRILAALCGGEPELVSATATERDGAPGVDERLTAELRFPNGVTGTAGCDMAYGEMNFSHRLVGTAGEVMLPNYVKPHLDDRLLVTTADGTRTEHTGERSSYTYQLEAFAAAVRGGPPVLTDAADATATMRLIDACYRAAGLPPRPTTPLD